MSGFDFILWNKRFIIDPFFFFFLFLFLRGDFCADFSSLAFSAHEVFSAHEGLLLRFRFWHKLTLGLSWFKLLFRWGSFEMLLLIAFFWVLNLTYSRSSPFSSTLWKELPALHHDSYDQCNNLLDKIAPKMSILILTLHIFPNTFLLSLMKYNTKIGQSPKDVSARYLSTN